MNRTKGVGGNGGSHSSANDGSEDLRVGPRDASSYEVRRSEVSRHARKNSIVHKFVETLEEHGVSLYWHAQGFETLLPSGKRNPAASMMLALLAEIARSETETLRERIISGLKNARRQGKVLGRRRGSALSRRAFLRKHKDVVRCLRAGHSIRHIAKITEKGVSTVQRAKQALAT